MRGRLPASVADPGAHDAASSAVVDRPDPSQSCPVSQPPSAPSTSQPQTSPSRDPRPSVSSPVRGPSPLRSTRSSASSAASPRIDSFLHHPAHGGDDEDAEVLRLGRIEDAAGEDADEDAALYLRVRSRRRENLERWMGAPLWEVPWGVILIWRLDR